VCFIAFDQLKHTPHIPVRSHHHNASSLLIKPHLCMSNSTETWLPRVFNIISIYVSVISAQQGWYDLRDLYARYQSTPASDLDQRAMIVNTLIREAAIHSDAEELSVYKALPADILEHDKEEHAEVKRLMYEADSKSIKSGEYDSILGRAVSALLEHADEEERDQLPQLIRNLTPERNHELALEFLKARKMVPTRPHPSAPRSGGIAQKLAGVQGSVHDKLVEMMEGRKFVELKYQHPEL